MDSNFAAELQHVEGGAHRGGFFLFDFKITLSLHAGNDKDSVYLSGAATSGGGLCDEDK